MEKHEGFWTHLGVKIKELDETRQGKRLGESLGVWFLTYWMPIQRSRQYKQKNDFIENGMSISDMLILRHLQDNGKNKLISF